MAQRKADCEETVSLSRRPPFGRRLRLRLASSTALSAGALMLAASGAAAATVTVTDQPGFDAAIQQAITTGQPNTINVLAPSTIYANTGLVLPGLASPLNLNFGLAPILGVGSDSTVGSLTIGAGTNLTFTPTTDIARFRVGRDPGGNGTVTMTGGTVTANESGGQYLTLGVGLWGATGAFNQSGGTVNVAGGSFQVGANGGQGSYNLSGDGAVIGSGGPIYATTVYIGDSTDSSGGVGALHGVGVLHISGNATFALTAETGGAVWVGNNGGEGTITQDGAGSHVVISGAEVVEFGTNSQYVGAAGTGTYNLINGSLDIADNGAGYGAKFGALAGGFGYFNQSGGVFTSENSPIIFGSGGVGQYNLSGGTATFAAGLIIAQNAGSTGAVNQTGGILTLTGGQIQFGAGDGAYNLNGGTLQIGGVNPIATGAGAYQFNLGGGTIQVIGSALTTNVNATLTAGSASTIDTNGLGATFSGVLSGGGALAKAGAGTLVLSGVNSYEGGTTISGGVL
jgi:autotransporter-associated beta strand protein